MVALHICICYAKKNHIEKKIQYILNLKYLWLEEPIIIVKMY